MLIIQPFNPLPTPALPHATCYPVLCLGPVTVCLILWGGVWGGNYVTIRGRDDYRHIAYGVYDLGTQDRLEFGVRH